MPVFGISRPGRRPLALVRTLGDVYRTSLARTSNTLVPLAIGGAMALLLGVGIYAVVSALDPGAG